MLVDYSVVNQRLSGWKGRGCGVGDMLMVMAAAAMVHGSIMML